MNTLELAAPVERCSARGDARPTPTPPGDRAGNRPAAEVGRRPVRAHLAPTGDEARWAPDVQARGGEARAWTRGAVATGGTRRPRRGGRP